MIGWLATAILAVSVVYQVLHWKTLRDFLKSPDSLTGTTVGIDVQFGESGYGRNLGKVTIASTGSAVRLNDVRDWGLQLDSVALKIGARFACSATRHRVRSYLIGLLAAVQRKNS